jgi:hypothetical protein
MDVRAKRNGSVAAVSNPEAWSKMLLNSFRVPSANCSACCLGLWRNKNCPRNRSLCTLRADLPYSIPTEIIIVVHLRDCKLLAWSLGWIQIDPCPTASAKPAWSYWFVRAAIQSTDHLLLLPRSVSQSASSTSTDCLGHFPAAITLSLRTLLQMAKSSSCSNRGCLQPSRSSSTSVKLFCSQFCVVDDRSFCPPITVARVVARSALPATAANLNTVGLHELYLALHLPPCHSCAVVELSFRGTLLWHPHD